MGSQKAGFTLIEMSIVLVIIGLVVGGVLVGQDLIRAAYVRATITQVEQFNTAVNTFYGKYQALPGDMNATTAQTFGFTPRGSSEGEGDGSGLLEGLNTGSQAGGLNQCGGETILFWEDLTSANGKNLDLIRGSFSAAASGSSLIAQSSSPTFYGKLFPEARLGGGNYFYVYSGGWQMDNGVNDGANYYGLSAPDVSCDGSLGIDTIPGLTVAQAYSIDQKVDDGMPQTGRVMAMYLNTDVNAVAWAAGGCYPGGGNSGDDDYSNNGPVVSGDGVATPPSATTCYDNANVAGAFEKYSVGVNRGSGLNCALSLRFQ